MDDFSFDDLIPTADLSFDDLVPAAPADPTAKPTSAKPRVAESVSALEYGEPAPAPAPDPDGPPEGFDTYASAARLESANPVPYRLPQSEADLAQPEGMARIPYASPGDALATAAGNAPFNVARGFSGAVQGVGESMLPNNEPKSLLRRASDILKVAKPGGRVPEMIYGALPDAMKAPVEAKMAEMGGALAEWGKEYAEKAGSKIQPTYAKPGSATDIGAQAFGSTLEMAPALSLTVLTKSPVPVMSFMGAYAGGSAYTEGREQGLGIQDSQEYGLAYAAAEAIGEGIQVGRLLSLVKAGKGPLRVLFDTAVTNAVEEMITEALQAGIDKGYITPDMTWGEARERVVNAGQVGAVAGPMMGATVAGQSFLQDKLRSSGSKVGEAFGELVDAAEFSPTVSIARGLMNPDNAQYRAAPDLHTPRADLPLTEEQDASPIQNRVLQEGQAIIDAAVEGRPIPAFDNVPEGATPASVLFGDVAEDAPEDPATPAEAAPVQPAPVAPETPTTPPVSEPAAPVVEGAPEVAAQAAVTDTVLLDPSEIKADPERFQFKSGGDAQGVTGALTDTRIWSQEGSGVSIVWEAMDGQRYIVDGHQRLGLAKRLQAQGQDPKIRALVLREADGVTADDAMLTGALKNLQEGGESTSALDIAKVFRRGGATDAVMASIPPARKAFRDGKALANLGDNAFGMVVNEAVPQNYAAEVGRQIEGDAAQVAALDYLAKNEPANAEQARLVVGQMRAAGFATETQTGLFGEEEIATPLFTERARILDNSSKYLRTLGKVFKVAIDSESVLAEAGNVLDSDANKAGLSDNQKLGVALERLSQRKGPVSDALSEQAKRLASGEITVGQARGAFLEAVRAIDAGGNPTVERMGGRADSVREEAQAGQVRDPEAGREAAAPVEAPEAAPLYVERKVLNAADIIEWAKSQGFPSTLLPDDMHITVTFSRDPVDVTKVPAKTDTPASGPGTPTTVKKLGDAVVLAFPDGFLKLDRDHKRYRDAGASFDFDTYQPHVTITYEPGNVDLAKVEPYRGQIQLGPEIQKPLNPDAGDDVKEVPTGAAPKTEQTPEGEQTIIPGAEKISDRALAERQQDKPKRGGAAPMADDSLFGDPALRGPDMLDMLDAAPAKTESAPETGDLKPSSENKAVEPPPPTFPTTLEAIAPKGRASHVYAEYRGGRYYLGSEQMAWNARQAQQEAREAFPGVSVYTTDRADGTSINGGWDDLRAVMAESDKIDADAKETARKAELKRVTTPVSKRPEKVGAYTVEPDVGNKALFGIFDAEDTRVAGGFRTKAEAVEAAGKMDAPEEAKPFDAKAFDKERADTIAASRAAGNTHLDKIEPAVETMRGLNIYYAHDPKVRGVISSVTNRRDVVVNWSDAYSAEKEMATETKDGRKTVMQSWLLPSDLKDYVAASAAEAAAAKSATGDKKAADKLRAVADAAISRAEEDANRDRQDNTARRARMAGNAVAEANRRASIAREAKIIADMIEDGTAGPLSAVRSLKDVEALHDMARRAQWNRIRKDDNLPSGYKDSGSRPASPPTVEDAKWAEAESLYVHPSDVRDLTELNKKYKGGAALALRGHDGKVPARNIEAFYKLATRIKASKDYSAKKLQESVRGHKAAVRLGVDTKAGAVDVMTALIEATRGKVKQVKADPVKEARRALIGSKIPGFFETPEAVASRMAEMADIKPGDKVLEPSAGAGRIANAVKEAEPKADLEVIEQNNSLREILELQGFNVVATDFMSFEGGPYDVILMNPPFEKDADMKHVQRAYDLLKPGGRLVAITGRGAWFRETGAAPGFREWFDEMGGTQEELPDGTFKESGTGVNSNLLSLTKPEEAKPAAVQPEAKLSRNFDMRGKAFAVTNLEGTVVASGSNPAMGSEVAETSKSGYYMDMADQWGGSLFIAPVQRISGVNEASDLILGMTWDEIQAKQQNQIRRRGVVSRMPSGAVEVYSAVQPEAKPESPPKAAPSAKADKIEDFGEKLAGARKDAATEYAAKMKDAATTDLAAEPLSKSWPQPDYQALLDAGTDPWVVGFIRAARDTVPNKPRGWKLKGWVAKTEVLRDFAMKLIADPSMKPDLIERMEKPEFKRIKDEIGGLIDLYEAVGHDVSLNGITLNVGEWGYYNGKEQNPPLVVWTISKPRKATAFSNMPRIISQGPTKEAAIADFKTKVATLAEEPKKAKRGGPVRFDIYSSDRRKTWTIGKKFGRDYVDLKTGFTDVKEVRAYLAENQEALEAQLAKMRDIPSERKETNSPRVGIDHRNGGDVTPEAFTDAFGFRGVQFGNWVEGGRRQADLNESYDALMDLAGILNIPAKALSLNGELGLAFGARGSGGKNPAAAHYEPGKIVINLTKKSGAGSLAHEWFHGMDSYFSRSRGRPLDYITDQPRPRVLRAGEEIADVRPELLEAFQSVRAALNQTALKARSQKLDRTRSKPYFGTGIEMHARAFESYVVAKLEDQSASNDYLANIIPPAYWETLTAMQGIEGETFPYLKPAEIPVVRAAFDNLFDTIQTEETDKGVRMYSRRLPYYSATLRAAEGIQQEKGNGLQWLAMIRKVPGVKAEEVDWLGLPQWLGDRKGVTKAEVLDYIRVNQVTVQEVTKQQGISPPTDADADAIREWIGQNIEDPTDWNNAHGAVRSAQRGDQQAVGDMEGLGVPDDLLEPFREYVQGAEGPRYASYALPGGENYRELLITMPPTAPKFGVFVGDNMALPREFDSAAEAREAGKSAGLEGRASVRELDAKNRNADTYKSPHYDEPNILATVRFDEREVDGKRVLFVQEIQSDWHQAGRKKGYKKDQPQFWVRNTRSGNGSDFFDTMAEAESYRDALPEGVRTQTVISTRPRVTGEVPDAPLKHTWHETAFRRAVAWATENGFDTVAWTPGDMQAERYDLSKQVDSLIYQKNGDGTYRVQAEIARSGENMQTIGDTIAPERLEDYVGKDIAKRILDGVGADVSLGGFAPGRKRLDADNLKVGGEGMKGFYDRILPAYAKKWGKKFGATVGTMKIVPTTKSGQSAARLQEGVDAGFLTESEVWQMPVTDAMRETVQAEGIPLFSDRGATPEFTAAAPAVAADLRKRLDAYNMKGVTLKLEDTISGVMDDGTKFSADGYYLNGLIAVALDGTRANFTLDHEAVHAMRSRTLWGAPDGLFRPAEWRTLEKAAVADTERMADVEARYPDLTRAQQVEEAVANMFADWQGKRMEAKGFIRSAFERVRNFLRAFGSALRGNGFNTPDSVMRGMASGDVGRRSYEVGKPIGTGKEQAMVSAVFSKGKKITGILAYHGSPHDFDAFDLSRIGTGEGAQAYGHGLYFADNETVARSYRDNLSDMKPSMTLAGRLYRQGDDEIADYVVDILQGDLLSKPKTPKAALREALESVQYNFPADRVAAVKAQISEWMAAPARYRGNPQGRMYEVNINADPADFLDWDAPLSKQSEKVRTTLEDLISGAPGTSRVLDDRFNAGPSKSGGYEYKAPGGRVYSNLDTGGGVVSERLREAGIPGIKYLDQGSRTAGDGSRNYVVFNDSLVTITRKYSRRDTPQFSRRSAGGFSQEAMDDGQDMRADSVLVRALNSAPVDQAFSAAFRLGAGLNEKGEWKRGVKIADEVARRITEAKFTDGGTFGFMNPVIEKARAGLVDRYGLPAEYIERERRRSLDERKIIAEVPELLAFLKSNNIGAQEAKVLQAVLTNEAVGAADMAKIAAPIRAAIDQMGAEAVMLGMISPESYERNRGAYLHRVYSKNEGDQGNLTKWASDYMQGRRRKIIGDQFKGRGLFEKVKLDKLTRHIPGFVEGTTGVPVKGDEFIIMDKVDEPAIGTLGEIDPAKPKVMRRVFLPAGKPIPGEFSGWTNRGKWEVRQEGKEYVLWRDFTKDERVKMGEITDARYTIAKTYMLMAKDLASGRFFKDIAANEEWTQTVEPPAGSWKDASEYTRFWADSSVQWVRVPETKISKSNTYRYGTMAGKFVRAEIWRDMEELNRMQTPGFWDTMLRQWKLNKTARSPVVHMNNVMSNFMLMDMAGIGAGDLAKAVSEMHSGGPMYQNAVEHGAFGSDMIAQEIRENELRPMLREIGVEMQGKSAMEDSLGLLGRIADKVFETGKTLDKKMTDAYQAEDEIFRLAVYIRRVRQGVSPEQAAIEARDQFMNYDIRAPWVNAARRSVLPFISYTYRAGPIVARTIATRPWKLAKYATVAYALNALAYALAPSDDDEETERKSFRESDDGYTWIGSPRMLRLPMLDDYGNPKFIDIRRWVPAGDIFDTGSGDLPAWAAIGGPLQLGAELALNRSAFTGNDIVNKITDDYGERMSKRASYVWKAWMPSAAWVPWSWYFDKLILAGTGGLDAQMRDVSLTNSALSSVGIKVRTQDVDYEMGWREWSIDQAERELKRQSGILVRQRDRNQISEAAFESGMEKIIRKLDRASDKRRELNE